MFPIARGQAMSRIITAGHHSRDIRVDCLRRSFSSASHEAIWGSGDIAPAILKLGTGWAGVSPTCRPLYPGEGASFTR